MQAATTAGVSAQALDEAVVGERGIRKPVTVDASIKVLGETADDKYDIGCEGYSGNEFYEYHNGHVPADEGFTFQLIPSSPEFK